jgi:hypothetical protein
MGVPGRTKLGELLPAGAATRVEWFFTSHLTKPNDFLVKAARTLVAVDNMIYPKYGLVFDWSAQGQPRYRYAAQLEDSQAMGPSYTAAATTDEALFILRRGNAGADVLVYAISRQGLIPRAILKQAPPPPGGSGDPDEPEWGGGLAILGEHLVMGAGSQGLAHAPVSVQGGWRYDTARGGHGFGRDESTTKGDLCDDAGGKWGCRSVELRKAHPAAVGPAPRFELLSLGGAGCFDLVVRQGRAYVLASLPGDKREVVVVAWDPAAKALRVAQRTPLPIPSTRFVR